MVKTFDVGVYIDMHDYHNVEGNDDGREGMFHINVQAENPEKAMEQVQDDCIESNCPYTCEPHTASEVKQYA